MSTVVQPSVEHATVLPSESRFRLEDGFVQQYANRRPDFGFNGLGEFTYLRTYSRLKPDGSKEQWFETIRRVVEGTYTIQKRHILTEGLPWNEGKAQRSAQEMYERMFAMKFLPPGRGLWMMGTDFVEKRGGAALNNCAFISTADISTNFSKPFTFMMDASMLGVGVGFDTEGVGKITIKAPDTRPPPEVFVIPDSREGWVESLSVLLETYIRGGVGVKFDYSQIRPAGVPIKGFGGTASGPGPLKDLHDDVRVILGKLDGKPITRRAIVDIMNLIGRCVIAGNVRRTAQIALGDSSEEYLDLKNYKVNPERVTYGWSSNNSVGATLGQPYKDIADRIRLNGEPGLFWVQNAQEHGRINGRKVKRDKATGVNPCAEQVLESGELCTLVETFPARAESKEDYLRTLKFAYLYAKTVTLTRTHWPESNAVMKRNRRIGLSMTGIVQFIAQRGIDDLISWSEEGYKTVQHYDEIYSDWLAVPRSIRTTTVKPSGSVSLLAGATPGVHFPESRFYKRRIRVAKTDPLWQQAEAQGYHVEDDVVDKTAKVVTFPVDAGEGVRADHEVSMWEKLSLAALLQRHWSDNAVSVTVKFGPEETNQIEPALEFFQYQLKTVSFLNRDNNGYEQMPYEPITEEEYWDLAGRITSTSLSVKGDATGTKFCDGDVCVIG